MKFGSDVVVCQMLVDLVSTAMQDDQLYAKMIKQSDVMDETDKSIRIYDFIRYQDDKSFLTVRLDIRCRSSEPLDVFVIFNNMFDCI